MSSYQRNNIAFRISSADAISKFKAAQMHSFFQLIRKDLGFNDAAKEAVLLEFDRFSEWMFKTERICVAMSGTFNNQSIQTFCDSFLDEQITIENVMDRYTDVFSSRVVKFSKIIHKYTAKMIQEKIKEIENMEIDKGFVRMVTIMGDYLQHFLVSMHEFNNNVISKKEEPFLSIADFCISNYDGEKCNVDPCASRAKFFVENDVSNKFILKNYTDKDIFGAVTEALSSQGIILIKENHDQLESV
jgi:hypothetical protein